jgi:hypothetical protein
VPARNSFHILQEKERILAQLAKATRYRIGREYMRSFVLDHYGIDDLMQKEPDEEMPAARQGAVLRTGLREAIEKALGALHGDFTFLDVIKQLKEDKYPLAVKNPRTGVGHVLRKLLTEKVLIQVKKGVGGEPTVYRKAR